MNGIEPRCDLADIEVFGPTISKLVDGVDEIAPDELFEIRRKTIENSRKG